MFRKGQTVRSPRTGLEYEVSISEKESGRFAVYREDRDGTAYDQWFDADMFELVRADEEEAFEPKNVAFEVEVSDWDGCLEPTHIIDRESVEFSVIVGQALDDAKSTTRGESVLEKGTRMHEEVLGYLTTRGLPPPAPAAVKAVTESERRKGMPLCTGVLDYFPDALAAVARLSKAGNDKHNPGQPLHHARAKSSDHADCLLRHLMDRGEIDPETGEDHAVAVAWRALALLQELMETKYGAKKARGAK